MEKEQKKEIIILGLSAALFVLALLLPLEGCWRLVAFVIPWFLSGHEVLEETIGKLFRGQLLDEDFLMSLASIGAFCLGEYPEAAAVMLLFQLGEFFEDYAEGRSRRSIEALLELCPEEVRVERDGQELSLPAEEVAVGDMLLLHPGDRIAADGRVESGRAALDASALTGEALPVDVGPGDFVRAGCICLDGVLRLRVSAAVAESTVRRILALVEGEEEGKSRSENFIRRFARVYTPLVVGAAALVFVLGGLISGLWADWLRRALVFLVVSCPCALVISVPLSFFAGLGAASRRGILFKGSGCMEALAGAEIAAFDKTGTLTQGRFHLAEIHSEGMDKEALLRLLAGAERFSSHPIAKALVEAAGENLPTAEDVREQPGLGLTARVEGHELAAGNRRLLARMGLSVEDCDTCPPGSRIYAAVDGIYAGHITVSDTPKPGVETLAETLKKAGIRQCVMLSGDRRASAEALGNELGFDAVFGELSPEDKLHAVQELKKQGRTVFVGDGINDAPVLAGADVGAAMGALGSDAAVEAADVVFMDDDPARLAQAIRLSRGTVAIVKQNIVFSLAVKALVMVLGAFGYAPLWLAVFADVGVCALAIGNALRALRLGK